MSQKELHRFLKWLKWDLFTKVQHVPYDPPRVKNEPYWVTKIHHQKQYDFRTGKRNDGNSDIWEQE